MGSIILSGNNIKKSIIDGQQRITSITLLLIYLFHFLPENEQNRDVRNAISTLVYSEEFGEKSFNISDGTREPCLKALFKNGQYKPQENENKTVRNMVERYNEICDSFPEAIDEKALPYFIDWLKHVIVIEIIAYSDDNAYTIFETMNDRGLNLTSTEMLKGYVLSKITNTEQQTEIDNLWKDQIHKLNEDSKNTDISFFQAWFRGKYAKDIRPGHAGAEDKDFELIGSQFHRWFKEKHQNLFKLESSDSFYSFFKEQFPFHVKYYLKIKDKNYDSTIPHLYYIKYWGIAPALQDLLLLSVINFDEDRNAEDVITKKLDFIARYIETFTVRRAINLRLFAHSTIRHTIFDLMLLVRNKNLTKLSEILVQKTNNIKENWEGILDFRLHGQNKKFVKHFLSRISSYIDILANQNSNYSDYHHPKEGKAFEIEHLLNNKYEEYKEEFEEKSDFETWRESIGSLILLPNGSNQSYGKKKYEEKLEHYFRENTYAQTLHPKFYENNPNFLNSKEIQELGFKPHQNFKKQDIEERKELVKIICEQLWSTDYFK